jgi:hypothetical protein
MEQIFTKLKTMTSISALYDNSLGNARTPGVSSPVNQMEMKKNCFNDLSLELKSKIVEEFAIPLLSIEYYDYRLDLFALNAMLIERFENIDSRQVEKISQAAYRDLDKYLSRIVIGNLKKHLQKAD